MSFERSTLFIQEAALHGECDPLKSRLHGSLSESRLWLERAAWISFIMDLSRNLRDRILSPVPNLHLSICLLCISLSSEWLESFCNLIVRSINCSQLGRTPLILVRLQDCTTWCSAVLDNNQSFYKAPLCNDNLRRCIRLHPAKHSILDN